MQLAVCGCVVVSARETVGRVGDRKLCSTHVGGCVGAVLGVSVSVAEWWLTGHRYVLQKGVQWSIILQNVWESQGDQSRPTSYNLPGEAGSELGGPLDGALEGPGDCGQAGKLPLRAQSQQEPIGRY